MPESSSPVATRRRPVISALGHARTMAPGMSARVSRVLVRAGYRLVNRSLREIPRNCLNYGWAPLDGTPPPDIESDPDHYGLQLYRRVTAAADLQGKDVVEIGCGRGGGSAFLHSDCAARSVLGVDLTPSSVRWCQQRWDLPDVRFAVGDAEALTLASGSFDALINVESSHNYPHVERFLAEAFRVLRPGGQLLLADLREAPQMIVLRDQITAAGFAIREEEDITANVVRSLELDSQLRRQWVDSRFPRPLRQAGYEFAGAAGTGIFEALQQRTWCYHRFAASKP